tara:strand:- start:253 stop:1038 length:786 start_codon:yes stop_codon:yes gene_type:complete
MAEAQTLTYDANEQPEGELNAEEKEALEVGEKLAEQQETLLAGKFKDAEELEKGYIELQKKLGSSEEKAKEEVTETKDEKVEEKEEETELDTALLESLWEEGVKGEYTKETLQKLADTDSREIAQMYLKYRSENQKQEQTSLTEENITQLKSVVGGEGEYDKMMKWAGESLQEDEVKMYDAVMDKGDPLAAFFAVQALTYRYNDSRGVDGQMLQGKAPTEKGDTFRSQAEVVRAMSDPRYDQDPAYRQDIYDKLERSNLKF